MRTQCGPVVVSARGPGFRGMSAAERSSVAITAARSGLLRSLNASARLAARRGGAEALARALSFGQPLRALLLPAALEVMMLRPELADAGGSSPSGEAAAWPPGVELGLFVTLAKATRLLCSRAVRGLASRQGGGGGGEAAPEAEAVSAAASVALASFHLGSVVAEAVVLCPQRLLGPDLVLRLAASAGRLMAALKPRTREPDHEAMLLGLLSSLTGSSAAAEAAATSGGGAAAALTGALLSAAYYPPTALTQAATHEALCPGVWAALRALPAAGGAAGTSVAGSPAATSTAEDLAPLLGVTRQLNANHGRWLSDLAEAARVTGVHEEFRRRAGSLLRRIAADASSKGLNGTKAAWASGAGGAQPDVDAAALSAAVAAVRLCGNPLCARFEGPAEAAVVRKTCGGCRRVRYCGASCQREHWEAGHKAECKALAAEAGAEAAGAGSKRLGS
ncbi:hypothetical protein GPECTOR_8g297 [Gonium pectorale]|uniref:phytol kinase n=1 Tax=Gonium pectorale TaxID=33097 RepID=A0A150GSR8_GONPE|nr:hypothetical protein GPECTOR_8g297 [Gonium pectorale]|eukprot:KXZ52919.1 hypothetical protein GPECTOR_8g297 [Gonium pectorale]